MKYLVVILILTLMSCSKLEYPIVTRYKFNSVKPITYRQTNTNPHNRQRSQKPNKRGFNIKLIEWPAFAIGMWIGLEMIKE
jgi:hypothetical protein